MQQSLGVGPIATDPVPSPALNAPAKERRIQTAHDLHSRASLVKRIVIINERLDTAVPRSRQGSSIVRRTLRLLSAAAGLLLASSAVHAQAAAAPQATPPAETSQPATTIAVNARLVAVPVVVRDKKGVLVPNLTQADFALEVDGKPQPIRYFDKDANLPLTLGLLVDTSGSVSSSLDEERSASAAFLEGMLKTDKDRAFIMQFAHQAELLQDLTSSKPKLQAALKELDTDSPDRNQTSTDPDNNGNNGGGRRRAGGGTTLYDAAFLAGDELMKKQTGRKALILLTDGEDRGSRESLASAIEANQRADTILYAIYFKGEEHGGGGGNRGGGFPGGAGRGGGIGFPGGGGGGGYPGGGGRGGGGRNGGGGQGQPREDGKKVLERMTGETGGRLFEVSKKHTFADIYAEIAEELRAQYRLGFTPTDQAAADGYHQLLVTAPNDKNLRIQTRDGYYTGTK